MTTLMPAPPSQLTDALATTLLANLAAFQAFARRRLGDDQLAADAVQESLLRALKSERSLAHDENLLGWFYRILRNVLTDLHRRGATRARAMERFADELEIDRNAEADLRETACSCFRGLLPAMRPAYAEVIELTDLEGLPGKVVAE